jgi:hypothetical protein
MYSSSINSYGAVIVCASELRAKEKREIVPNDKPGWYRWWATSEAMKLLLNSKLLNKKYFDEILPYLTKRNDGNTVLYSLYVGVAIKESIRSRLNWHINQHHTKSSVSKGFLSTFRQSVSSLIAGNQYDELATNNLIDMLLVEYVPIDFPIHSEEAKHLIEQIELTEMTERVYPLNIKDNKQPIVQSFKSELRRVRSNSK